MLKRKFVLLAVLCLVVMSAVPSWGAKSGKEKQQKISDSVFIKMCKSGRARDIQYAIRSKGADINVKVKDESDDEIDDDKYITLLMYAAKYNSDPEVICGLLSGLRILKPFQSSLKQALP